nr:MAK10-like protein [Tanacetum cinerariifolium]
MGDENPIRTLGDYSKPSHEGYRNTIDLPVGNNVVHLRSDSIRSITTCEDLTTRFLAQFFPPGRDFAKPVKEIALPQDIPSTSDRRLIKLENQVQRLMKAHLAPIQPTQVSKITTSCEICNGPHDTQYCMDDSKQAYVDYASSSANRIRGKRITPNKGQGISMMPPTPGRRNQTSTRHDDVIGKIKILWKTISEKLNDVSTLKNKENSMATKSITAISHVEKEELRKKGIKSPSKFFSLKYLSIASIKELNENSSAPKHIHFVNSIVILIKDRDTKEDVSSTNVCRHDLGKMTGGNKEVKEQGKEEDEMETDIKVEEKPSNPDKISNFVGTVRSLKFFIGSFAYECDFMILEDTTSIIDRCLGEMVFGRPFIDETGLVYNKEEGTVMIKQDNEKIKFKMPHTMEVFKQTRLMGASTDSIPSLAHEENFSNGRMHYYQSLLIRDEYRQDEGDRRGVRHLMRLEKEIMDDKGEVT